MPSESSEKEESDHRILSDLFKLPEILEHFDDLDQVDDLLDSLNTHELRIIIDSKDPKMLLKIKREVEDDINESAKQLAMME